MSSLIRLYPACYKGDIQAINAGSLDVHINLQYKKWKEAGKMVEDNHAHQTQIYIFKKNIIMYVYNFYFLPGLGICSFAHRSSLIAHHSLLIRSFAHLLILLKSNERL